MPEDVIYDPARQTLQIVDRSLLELQTEDYVQPNDLTRHMKVFGEIMLGMYTQSLTVESKMGDLDSEKMLNNYLSLDSQSKLNKFREKPHDGIFDLENYSVAAIDFIDNYIRINGLAGIIDPIALDFVKRAYGANPPSDFSELFLAGTR